MPGDHAFVDQKQATDQKHQTDPIPANTKVTAELTEAGLDFVHALAQGHLDIDGIQWRGLGEHVIGLLCREFAEQVVSQIFA